MIQSVIKAMAQLEKIKSGGDSRFNFPCPVCWFGNLDTDKPVILTMGINPSDEEFDNYQFRGFTGDYANPQDCIDAYNDYFKRKPYSQWFDEQEAIINCKSSHVQHSRAIKFLSGCKSLDASYYDGAVTNECYGISAKYQLVHIDLFPFATDPVWGSKDLNLPKQTKSQLFAYGMQLIAKIIEEVKPKLILSFGGFESKTSALKEYFGNDFVLDNAVQIPKKSNFSKLTPRKMAEGSITINGIKTPIIFTSAVAADVNRIYGITDHVDHLLILADKYLTGAKLPI